METLYIGEIAFAVKRTLFALWLPHVRSLLRSMKQKFELAWKLDAVHPGVAKHWEQHCAAEVTPAAISGDMAMFFERSCVSGGAGE